LLPSSSKFRPRFGKTPAHGLLSRTDLAASDGNYRLISKELVLSVIELASNGNRCIISATMQLRSLTKRVIRIQPNVVDLRVRYEQTVLRDAANEDVLKKAEQDRQSGPEWKQ
jgi:hypothetical protein